MIYFFKEQVNFRIIMKKKIYHIINKIIKIENSILHTLSIIFTSDKFLIKINKKYLFHNYYTDVLTFNYAINNNIIYGDIFISIDRIKINCIIFNTTFINELVRVIIHGLLHLLGYNDSNNTERNIMRKKENFYLNLFNF
jgi:rRNA maturation RNase YbeY